MRTIERAKNVKGRENSPFNSFHRVLDAQIAVAFRKTSDLETLFWTRHRPEKEEEEEYEPRDAIAIFQAGNKVSRTDTIAREKKNSRRRNYGTKISRPEGITIFRKGWLCSGWVCVVQVNRRIRSGVDGLVAAMAHLWSKFTKCLRASEGASNPDKVLATPFGTYPTREKDRDRDRRREMIQRRVIRYYYIVAITISRKQRPSSNPLFSDLRLVFPACSFI